MGKCAFASSGSQCKHAGISVTSEQEGIYIKCLQFELTIIVTRVYTKFKRNCRKLIIIITLFQEDNIFGRVASLTYGPQLTNVGMIL